MSMSTAALIAPSDPAERQPSSTVSSPAPSGGKMSRADIAQVVGRNTAAVRRCYEAGLLEDPSLTGVIEIGWKIQVDGHVSSVNIVDAPKRNGAVEGCLLAEIGRWDFPPSPEPVVVGAYPFLLDGKLLTRRGQPALRRW